MSENKEVLLIVGMVTFAVLTFIGVFVYIFAPDSKADAARIEKTLPDGCTLVDLGRYGSIQKLVMVRCGDNVTTTGQWSVPAGKVWVEHNYTVVSSGG